MFSHYSPRKFYCFTAFSCKKANKLLSVTGSVNLTFLNLSAVQSLC
nr:MAG TPA: hypothetical protein [Caudoviricetes sp.]